MRNKLTLSKVWKRALCRNIIKQLKRQSELKAIHAQIGKLQLPVIDMRARNEKKYGIGVRMKKEKGL